MFQQNSFRLSRRIFLLLILFASTLFGRYTNIYDLENPQFEYTIENGNYKVYLLEEGSINYRNGDGFKLFLPNFVTEYNLGVLRLNSIGSINGILSLKDNTTPSISQLSQNIDSSNIGYYLTDYATPNQRQLHYLLKNEKIPYINTTSIAFQGFNIPKSISNHLNKWVFFSFLDNNEDNKLTTLLYSYSMILDKKLVDNFVKRNHKILKFEKDDRMNYIYTYISSFDKSKKNQTQDIQPNKKKEEQIVSEMEKSKKELNDDWRLDLAREFMMKDFEYIEEKTDRETVNNSSYSLEDNYETLQQSLNKLITLIEEIKISNEQSIFPSKNKDNSKYLQEIIKQKDILVSNMTNVEDERRSPKKGKCDSSEEPFNKDCLSNQNYLNQYIYNRLKKGLLPSEELIDKYGDGRTFNQIGKYYYEHKEYKKSEKYLLKGYEKLSKSAKEVVAYNLGVLYSSDSLVFSHKKAVYYFLKTSLEEGYFNLGIHYYNGQEVKENNKIAYDYFLKSSRLGYARGEINAMKMEKLYPSLVK